LACNAQGLRVIIVVVQVGAVEIYVAALEALRKKARGDETQFKLVEELAWVPFILFCKISFTVMHLMPLLCRNWPFLPLNCLTLQITLLYRKYWT
jgi:NADH:ubiquinone oxidoreductase subunit 6 (subunit J)